MQPTSSVVPKQELVPAKSRDLGEGMLIAIEGCVGAGKTTVAKGLASRRGSKLLLEDFQSNPFLRAFYEDPIGNAIETEYCLVANADFEKLYVQQQEE